MKNIKLIILACFLFMISSCELQETPYGFYSEENFFETSEDARSALYYAYQAINYREYLHVMYFINDVASEEMNYATTGSFGVPEIDFWSYNTFSNNEQLEFFFKYIYIGINRATTVIENVEKSNFEEQVKNRILGQAYFLRAWHYFYLARTYGLVPEQKTSVVTMEQTRQSLFKNFDSLYDFIIEDLIKASDILEIKRVVGLADKVAAESLLSKVYLTIGSAKESNVKHYRDMSKNVDDMYLKASEWAKKVLYDQSEYYLDSDLTNIYDIDKPKGSEHIFLLGFDNSGIEGWQYNIIPSYFAPPNSNKSIYYKLPDRSFYESVQGYAAFHINDLFVDSFSASDKRKTDLITNNKVYYLNIDGTDSIKWTNYLTLKYRAKPTGVGKRKSSHKPYLIRFSDIALIYAEAEGPTFEGYKWLNMIRDRAGLDNAPQNMSANDFRDFVIKERSFELAFEANRLFDLRRKAKVTTTDPYAKLSGISEEDAAYYPIPQKEIDLNPNIKK